MYYEVSDHGHVRSWKNGRFGRRKEPRLLKTSFHDFGYPFLEINGKNRFVHHLVLEAFVGPRPPEKKHCRHIDGNPKNNHVSNLAWATVKENANDRQIHGTQVKGAQLPFSKLKESDIPEIRRLIKTGVSCRKIGKMFNVSECPILLIKQGKTWKHVK